MRQKALAMILSTKVKDNELIIIDKIDLKDNKTKDMNLIFKNFVDIKKKNNSLAYVIVNSANKALIRASRNLPFAYVTLDSSVDLVTMLNFKHVIILKDAIPNLEKLLIKKS